MFRSKSSGTAFAVVSFFSHVSAFAASCCGGGAVAPQIIGSDYRAQVSSALSLTHLTLSGAYAVPRILDDRLQVSARLPLAYSVTSPARGIALGDFSSAVNFELLRGWEAEGVWSGTDVLGFFELQVPSGLSIYQMTSPTSLVSGGGFYRLSAGTYGARVFGDFDFLILLALHRDLARTLTDGSGDAVFIDPGFGASTTLGLGLSPGKGGIRIGLQATPIWKQGAVSIQPGIASRGQDELSLDLGASLAWLIDPTWTLSATYTEPVGALARERNLALLVQKRWWR